MVSPTTLPRPQRQVGDLGPHVGEGALLLGLDLGGGLLAQALELRAGLGDVRVARLLGDLLGTGEDLVRLTACLGQRGRRSCSALSRSRARLLGVLEALLDPRRGGSSIADDRLEGERPDQRRGTR